MSPKRLLGGLVKMISVNGLPLIGIDWEGMQDVIQPLCEAMNLTVNSHNMRQYVSKVAAGIDKEISMEVEGRLLSLKADIASKMRRSVLGLNAQFVDSKGELQKRTLAVAELAERHTGAYLKDEVFRILDHLGIRPQQIYSISIDNGSNMVKMASLMAKETLEDTGTYEFEEDLEGEEIVDGNHDEDERDLVVEGMLQELESIVSHTAVTVRCGAHTVQLVVSDACKEYQPELKKLSKLTVSYQNVKYKNFFDVSGGRYPPTPVATRWNSNYLMAVSLLDQKDFFDKLGQEFKELVTTT
ncbi:uncharacterized protein LOC134209737 [Armigeres subalbatus]|uniref:uncharacterized protein LOC134209737 n=1 Tax=Armigeres subalbatus TaxID=124917 RepID=UPI002ED18772